MEDELDMAFSAALGKVIRGSRWKAFGALCCKSVILFAFAFLASWLVLHWQSLPFASYPLSPAHSQEVLGGAR